MRIVVGRIADIITSLNEIATRVSDNDTVEFDVENRLNILETATDDLNTEVNLIVQSAAQMSEG